MSTDTETLSPAEAAYMKSGGSDTAALEQEYGAGDGGNEQPATPDPAAAAAATTTAGQDGAGTNDDDLDIDGDTLITVGPDGKPRGKNGQFVPHQAFHAVREKYKTTRDELAQTKEKFARVDERLALLNEVIGANQPKQAEQQQEEMPDPEKDIFAYVKWQAKQIDTLKSQLTDGSKKQESREAEQHFQRTYIADAMEFNTKTPDFKDAYVHLVNGRDNELKVMGMSDPAERKAFIAREEKAIVVQALQRKVSPSQMLYELAKSRGFTGKAAPAVNKNDPASKIENVRKQQAATNSLTGAGGSSGEGLTAAALADMSETEFEQVMSKLSKSERARLLGG
jgi:hypothetical protein